MASGYVRHHTGIRRSREAIPGNLTFCSFPAGENPVFDAVVSPYLVPFEGSFQIAEAPTSPPKGAPSKKKLEDQLDASVEKLDEFQRRLYADNRWSVLFFAVDGILPLEFRDGPVEVGPGEPYIVPMGVEHKPVVVEEMHIMMFEPASTLNTGNVQNELTVEEPERT